jgi:hypothetical protein
MKKVTIVLSQDEAYQVLFALLDASNQLCLDPNCETNGKQEEAKKIRALRNMIHKQFA